MAKYKNTSGDTVIDAEFTEGTRSISKSSAEYQEWIAEGNTPDPEFTPEEIASNEIAAANEIIDAELIEIDKASMRSMREWISAQPDAPQFLKDKETEAIAKREERNNG